MNSQHICVTFLCTVLLGTLKLRGLASSVMVFQLVNSTSWLNRNLPLHHTRAPETQPWERGLEEVVCGGDYGGGLAPPGLFPPIPNSLHLQKLQAWPPLRSHPASECYLSRLDRVLRYVGWS